MFADDTCIYHSAKSCQMLTDDINDDLHSIHGWSKKWQVKFNSSKTVALTISNKKMNNCEESCLLLDGKVIENVNSHKHLGIILNSNLTWSDHIDHICERSMKHLDAIKALKYKCNRKTLEIFYFSFVRPIMEYGQILFAGAFQKDLNKINKVEKEAKKIVTGAIRGCSSALLDIEIKWDNIATRRKNNQLIMFYRIVNGDAPLPLLNIYNNVQYVNAGRRQYNLRNEHLKVRTCKTKQFENTFFHLQ